MQGKKIVLGITGSIAAYKACELTRLLVKSGNEVQVVMTDAGKEFVSPLTLATLSRHAVVSEFFDRRDGSWNSHVDLGLWADIMLIAPATASTIAKMAHGIADNMLLTTYLSMRAPVVVAPAMDMDMYAHEATRANLDLLSARGVKIIEPRQGELASQLIGKGRMEEPEGIYAYLENLLCNSQSLRGKRILITAGPTYERIDPVRFIGNFSSGKMGFALAEACARRGATVQLVSGPTHLHCSSESIVRTDVESAGQMYKQAVEAFKDCDAAILCAAVADFTPAECAERKIKKNGEELLLRLVPTKDIAGALGARKTEKQVVVGFALETDNEVTNAKKKLAEKRMDFIVLNSLKDEGAAFGYDTNKITIINAGEEHAFPLKSKQEAAEDIIDELCRHLGNIS